MEKNKWKDLPNLTYIAGKQEDESAQIFTKSPEPSVLCGT